METPPTLSELLAAVGVAIYGPAWQQPMARRLVVSDRSLREWLQTGNFPPGQNGVYTLTAGNSGTAATNGTVTVSDMLPAILTAQSIAGETTLYVHTQGDPITVLASVRTALQALDPNLPLVRIVTLPDVLAQSLWASRAGAALLALFGLLGLIDDVVQIGPYQCGHAFQKCHYVYSLLTGDGSRAIARLGGLVADSFDFAK